MKNFQIAQKKIDVIMNLPFSKKIKMVLWQFQKMLYPKPSIKQQLYIMYQRPNFEKMLALSGTRNYDNNYYADIYNGNVWKNFPFDGSRFFDKKNTTSNLGLLLNLDWFQLFKYT